MVPKTIRVRILVSNHFFNDCLVDSRTKVVLLFKDNKATSLFRLHPTTFFSFPFGLVILISIIHSDLNSKGKEIYKNFLFVRTSHLNSGFSHLLRPDEKFIRYVKCLELSIEIKFKTERLEIVRSSMKKSNDQK